MTLTIKSCVVTNNYLFDYVLFGTTTAADMFATATYSLTGFTFTTPTIYNSDSATWNAVTNFGGGTNFVQVRNEN